MSQTNFTGGSMTVFPNGQLLRELRNKENKTQKQIEDAVGIPSPRLSTYEAGKPISHNHLSKLSIYFRVSMRVLTRSDSADIMSQLGTKLVGVYGWWEDNGKGK